MLLINLSKVKLAVRRALVLTIEIYVSVTTREMVCINAYVT